jgi:hypothetical protein
MQLIQAIIINFRYLLGLFTTETAGVKFPAGSKGDIQKIQVFFQTAPTVSF